MSDTKTPAGAGAKSGGATPRAVAPRVRSGVRAGDRGGGIWVNNHALIAVRAATQTTGDGR
jgi:hypothetical protein